MKFTYIKTTGSWRDVADAARTTVGKDSGTGEPSSEWKRRMLLAEHSPIRIINIIGYWENLKSWISVHLVRHFIGVIPFVSTQRDDRTGIDRNKLPQDAPVNHRIYVNQQAIINMSRRRLCSCAHPETRKAFRMAIESIKDVHPELYHVLVPDCIYRGYCYEMKSCGYHKTEAFRIRLSEYRKGINE